MPPLTSGAVVLRAPAKVNLGLRVLGRRPDGYHEIDTLCLALDLHDRLEITAGAEGETAEIELAGPAAAGVPVDGTNLAVRALRAAQALARERGRPSRDLCLRLEKRVPAAAGLGGGSADAAAAFHGAARLLGLDGDDPGLVEALARLGSDCAFFHGARATGLARCRGRGERVEPIADVALRWSLVVVTPEFGCSTASVYGALRVPPTVAGPPEDPRTLLARPPEELAQRLANDLEPVALRVEPELAEFRAWLEELAPRAFLLSGSGSSFFSMHADERGAVRLVEQLRTAAKARRCALRGAWLARPRGRGVEFDDAKSHSDEGHAACNP